MLVMQPQSTRIDGIYNEAFSLLVHAEHFPVHNLETFQAQVFAEIEIQGLAARS